MSDSTVFSASQYRDVIEDDEVMFTLTFSVDGIYQCEFDIVNPHSDFTESWTFTVQYAITDLVVSPQQAWVYNTATILDVLISSGEFPTLTV